MNAQNENQIDLEDEHAFDLLKRAIATLPHANKVTNEEAPQSVIKGALWIHDWLNMEADLAELRSDSATSDRALPVSTRTSGSLRQLKFASSMWEVLIEIEQREQSVNVSGTLSPVSNGKVQLVVGGQVYRSEIDSLGMFVITGVTQGTVLAFIEIEGQNLRLGSFEV